MPVWKALAQYFGTSRDSVKKVLKFSVLRDRHCTAAIRQATVKRFHEAEHDPLRRHLADHMDADNFGRRPQTLCGQTPCEVICKIWTSEPQRLTLTPLHRMPGLNTQGLVPAELNQS